MAYPPNQHSSERLSVPNSLEVISYSIKKLFFFVLIYFIDGCVGSSFLCEGFLQLWQAGATLHRGARASRYRGLSCCGAQAPDTQAQQLWLTGPAAPRHVGSSQTRARTRVPCIGRRILNHCATREAPKKLFLKYILKIPDRCQKHQSKCKVISFQAIHVNFLLLLLLFVFFNIELHELFIYFGN